MIKNQTGPIANNTVTISLENPPRNKENGTDTIRSNSNVTASLSLISSLAIPPQVASPAKATGVETTNNSVSVINLA